MSSFFPPRATGALLAATVASLPFAAGVQAQPYPTRAINMSVPVQAGSGADAILRIVAQRMSDNMKQPIVLENVPGAAGVIGAERAARAPADGYTIFGANDGTLNMTPHLRKKVNYDTLESFEPVSLLANITWVLIANPSLPVKSVKDLIALAKQRPGELTFASGGNGTSHHMGGELFGLLSGTKMSHVPFKGSPQAVGAVVSGEVALMFPNIPNAMGLAKAGKLRILGVTTPKRLSFWPELPTIAESGLPGYEVIAWFGLFAPAGTPSAVIDRVNAEANKALASASVRENLMAQGFELMGGTVAEFAAFVRSEIEKWAKVVKATGAKAD